MPSKDETVGPVIDHIPVITVFEWHLRTLWRKGISDAVACNLGTQASEPFLKKQQIFREQHGRAMFLQYLAASLESKYTWASSRAGPGRAGPRQSPKLEMAAQARPGPTVGPKKSAQAWPE
jgi:hypothetical protein